MAYLKINGVDFSALVNSLKVTKGNTYTAQTNAAGDTVVDYINSKRSIEVGFIPMHDADMVDVLAEVEAFNVTLEYRDPRTNELGSASCIIPSNAVEYYTIRADKVSYKAFTLTFTEL